MYFFYVQKTKSRVKQYAALAGSSLIQSHVYCVPFLYQEVTMGGPGYTI